MTDPTIYMTFQLLSVPNVLIQILLLTLSGSVRAVCPDHCDCLDWGGGPIVFCDHRNLTQVPDVSTVAQDGCINLLDLSGNDLVEISGSAFSGACIRHLDLSENPDLRNWDSWMSSVNITLLKELAIQRNDLDALPGSVLISLDHLEVLNARDNNIDYVHYVNFVESTDDRRPLERLYLGKNPLRGFSHSALACLPQLTTLEISPADYNQDLNLNYFGGSNSLGTLQSLRHLFLHDTFFLRDDTSFEFLSLFESLIALEISASPVNQAGLQAAVTNGYLSGLQYLTLEGTGRFTSLSHLSPLTNLISLEFRDNQLDTVAAGSFSSFGNLGHLVLKGNRISEIEDGAFNGLSSIHALDLSQNEVTTLTRAALPDRLESMRTVSIGGNPWSCDCNLKWLVDLIGQDAETQSPSPFSLYEIYNDLTCAGPGSRAGLALYEVYNRGILENC